MQIHLTNEASAKLLGIPLALYSDEVAQLGRELRESLAALDKLDIESDGYDEAFDRYVEAYRKYEDKVG